MKRDPALRALSWGHQRTLALAFRIREAVAGPAYARPSSRTASEGARPAARPSADRGGSAPVRRGARELREEVAAFWARELEPHFAAEESALFPAASAARRAPRQELERAVAEHGSIRASLAELRRTVAAEPRLLLGLADALVAHIRFEERVLFPRIEEALGTDGLEEVGREIDRRLPGAACDRGER